jgi:RNA polymerase-binding transcription factor
MSKTAKPAKKASAKAQKPVAKKAAPKKTAKPAKNGAPIKASKDVLAKKPVAKGGLPPMKISANDNEIIANAKVRFGTKDLDIFRKEIIKQRDEAKEEFDIISQQLLDTSGEYDAENQSFALHTAEQGSDAMEREKLFLQAQRTSDYIKKLDEALERIDRGTYGICVVCGNLIEKPRLFAVPITQKHVVCKNKTNAKRFNLAESVTVEAVEDNIE